MVFVMSAFAGALGVGVNWIGRLHPLYFRDNPGPGIIRLSLLLGMAWIGFVLVNFADPSVAGIYNVFYLVMGFAVLKVFGQTAVMMYGPRTRVDVCERKNISAAIVIGAFTLSTGLIFGGSLWGEADPIGDGEGGWWIPLSFFLLGWLVLLGAFGLFLQRERGSFGQRIRRDRKIADARAAATFLIGSAVTLTDAVSGDFWGWRHGLLSFGLIAGLLLVHEVFAAMTREDSRTSPDSNGFDSRRVLESVTYLALAAGVWLANRFIDASWGPG